MRRSQSKRSSHGLSHDSAQAGTASSASMIQGGNHIMQLQQMYGNRQIASLMKEENPIQKIATEETESTGTSASPSKMPAPLQQGLENLSGMDLSDVNVHYQSNKPAQVGAHAYAQGNDIHLAPGQEKHLPHEGWHVVQQRQGRVKADAKVNNVAVNEDPALEQEATKAGEQAMQLAKDEHAPLHRVNEASGVVQQKKVIQMVKQAVPNPPDKKIVSMRNLVTLYRAQATEYIGHPLATLNGWNVDEIIRWLDEALVALGDIVTDMNLNDDSIYAPPTILQHYGNDTKLKAFRDNANNATSTVQAYFSQWTEWKVNNPETSAELTETRTGADLGDEKQAGITYGVFNSKLFKVRGSQFPEKADYVDIERYTSQIEKEKGVTKLKKDVSGLDMSGAVTIPRDSNLNSRSSGAASIRGILTASGDMYISRVMNAKEAQRVKDSGGMFVPKLGAAKWITIGTTANIHSSGDSSHDHSVQWKIDANFRKVLMMKGMNYYNENEDSSSDYEEPYWVWKDAEDGNIAISPVLNAIFNDMVKEVTIDGKKIEL